MSGTMRDVNVLAMAYRLIELQFWRSDVPDPLIEVGPQIES
jgi:hypothetical protein